MALIVDDYHDCLLGSSELSGLSALQMRLLEAQSYKVLHVRHDELKLHKSKLENVKLIESKLKKLLQS